MRKNLSPGFSISHDNVESFSLEEDLSLFGYEPFEFFLTTDINSEESANPRITLDSEEASEIVDDFSADIFMVYRYRRKDSDKTEENSTPCIDEFPVFKDEIQPCSLQVDSDFHAIVELLDDSVEEVTKAEYMYSSIPSPVRVNEHRGKGDYLNDLQCQKLMVWPNTYGINELKISPQNLSVEMKLYRQEVQVKHPEPEFKTYSGSTPSNEFVNLNYDESEVDEIEELLEEQGFKVVRNYLPGTISPPDI